MFVVNTMNNALIAAYVWAASLTHHEEGQTMAEYGLILAGVAVLVMVAIGLLSTQISATFTAVTTCLSTPASC